MIEIIDHGSVRELRLARAPVNALNCVLLKELDAAIMAAEAPALVLSGAAGIFSAGLDVREVTASEESARALVMAFGRLQLRLVHSPVPIIAAITGHSPAGGAVIAVLCDYRIMASGEFRIGLNEVQVGLYPGETIYRVLERLVGTRHAAALLPRGAMLRSDEALAAGLVDECVEPAAVVPRALALANELIALPPKTYQRTRDLVRRDLRKIFDQPSDSVEAMMKYGWVTEETRARMARFLTAR
ncbi:MAG: enoyl-CoA hydratase/isomerase family protein [Gammaproteobacteria bacterium]|nr:enoyl-CoA hydratase/isomerase family protein [Gammaproteobacteria bacterium]MBM4233902.1 enoyl-CoA hydratase/isomerase family protein [Gammaproteobacteria bacterium]